MHKLIQLREAGASAEQSDRTMESGEETCLSHCGVNANLSNISMPMKSRRPIRYMDRLKKSREYKSA
jgi:hypothetical protein